MIYVHFCQTRYRPLSTSIYCVVIVPKLQKCSCIQYYSCVYMCDINIWAWNWCVGTVLTHDNMQKCKWHKLSTERMVILVARDRAVSWQRQSSSSFHGYISGNTFRTPIAPFFWLVSHNTSSVLAAVDNGKKMIASFPGYSHFLFFRLDWQWYIYILYRNGRVIKNKKGMVYLSCELCQVDERWT